MLNVKLRSKNEMKHNLITASFSSMQTDDVYMIKLEGLHTYSYFCCRNRLLFRTDIVPE